MIFIILGMHKSGTTLISRILHDSGINMGEFDSSVSYDQGNQYERKNFQAINKKILNCGDAHSTSVITPVQNDYYNDDYAQQIKIMSEELNLQYENWGFKDPRSCLTYKYWKQHLPEHKTIYVFRSPMEVWSHYQKNIVKFRFIKRFLASSKALRAWAIYNAEVLRYAATDITSGKQCFVLEYSDFMNNKSSISSFSNFVGIKLKDMRDNTMYRAKSKPDYWYMLYCSYSKWVNRVDVQSVFSKLRKLEKGISLERSYK